MTAAPLQNPAPRGLFRLDGAWMPRRTFWVLEGDPLRCARKHLVADRGESVITCRECDAQIWVKRERYPRGPGARLWVSDLASEEARMIRELELTVDDVLRYLGATI
jgi:hypothetical protein